jgi:hypothetical protein
MKYLDKESKSGINLYCETGEADIVTINDNSGNRFLLVGRKKARGNWVKSPEQWWIYLGPPTLTEWSK